MRRDSLWIHLALGAAAGLAGTLALQALRAAEQKWLPDAAPPIGRDPGRFILHKAVRVLPEGARQRVYDVENAGSKLLALGYGMTFGALYAALRPKARRLLGEGVLLGLATWAAGYLGWLPATGLMPPIWKHRPKQVVAPIAEHALYGLATTAGLRLVQKMV